MFPQHIHTTLLQSRFLKKTYHQIHFKSSLSTLAESVGLTGHSSDTTSSSNKSNTRIDALAQTDHRVIGAKQRLFMFDPKCVGQVIFLPHGQRIVNTLTNHLRSIYRRNGYYEVSTPMIFSSSLWKTSGHEEYYKNDMFKVSSARASKKSRDRERSQNDLGLKPMNCPAHCLIYRNEIRSYRHLPMRLADFSPLHRNEASGGLAGLTRLRCFHQDDAHIFCTPDQMPNEISNVLDSIKELYNVLGLPYTLTLSTRPDKALGDPILWEKTEDALKECLEENGKKWSISKCNGAFYGPKIDIEAIDTSGRSHQCATIQLDSQLPIRFNLAYTSIDGLDYRPLLIHRALLGSIERMIALLAENFAGKWPLWLNPKQIMVCPVSERFATFALQLRDRFIAEEIYADVDVSNDPLGHRLRSAQQLAYNYIVVVGEQEQTSGRLTPKKREGTILESISTEAFISKIHSDVKAFL